MSSNYNYNYTLAHLNSLIPVQVPEMSDEDLARELEIFSTTQFLLDEDFQVSPTIDTKNDQNVTQPTLIPDLTTLTDQAQTQQPLSYLLFPTTSLVQNPLQPISIATSNNTFPPTMFSPTSIVQPTAPTSAVNNPIILSKETQENTPSTSSSNTNITTDSTPTVATKNTIKTTAATSNPPSSTNGSNRKSTKSNQSSTSETTQNGSAETKEGEKPDPTAKLAAEEDKRRRNTAASARFRVKKKMREQALERTAREMTTKAEMYEGRVKELEMEIKWLRSLIVEKDARLLDIERPGKRRKKDESENDEDNEDDDEKEKEVKQELSEPNKKE